MIWYPMITDTCSLYCFNRLRHVEYIPDVAAHQIANRFPAISVAIPPELLASGDLQIFMRIGIYGLTNFPIILTKNKIAYSIIKKLFFELFYWCYHFAFSSIFLFLISKDRS